MMKPVKSNAQKSEKPQKATVASENKKDARVEFEQRFDFFISQFRAACQEAKTPAAFAIVIDPKNPTTPFIFGHGHIFDQATLLASALRDVKRRIDEELSA